MAHQFQQVYTYFVENTSLRREYEKYDKWDLANPNKPKQTSDLLIINKPLFETIAEY